MTYNVSMGTLNPTIPYHTIPYPVEVFPLEFLEKFGPQKTRIMGLPGSKNSLTIGWAACDGQTDGQTDRRPAYINNVLSMTDAR